MKGDFKVDNAKIVNILKKENYIDVYLQPKLTPTDYYFLTLIVENLSEELERKKKSFQKFKLLLLNLVQFYFFSERSKDVSCIASDVRSRFLEMSEFEKAVEETTESDPNAFSWDDYRITLKSEEFQL